MSTAETLERGRQLFNEGKFFEAHEAWETAWRVEQGVDRLVFQGLIMAAAAFVKVGRSEPRGAVKLVESSLRVTPAMDERLALEPFRDRLAELLPLLRVWAEGGAEVTISIRLDRR